MPSDVYEDQFVKSSSMQLQTVESGNQVLFQAKFSDGDGGTVPTLSILGSLANVTKKKPG